MKRYLTYLAAFAVAFTSISLFADAIHDLGLTPEMLKALKKLPLKTIKRTGKSAPNFQKLEAASLGDNGVLLKLTLDRPMPVKSSIVVYIDVDNNAKTGRKNSAHAGVELMGMFNKGKMDGRIIGLKKAKITGKIDKNTLWLVITAPLLIKDNQVYLKMHFLSQEPGVTTNYVKDALYSFPVNTKLKPPIPVKQRKETGVDPRDWRYSNALVKYLPLRDKGLKAADIKKYAPVKVGRPCPKPLFAKNSGPTRKGSVSYRLVPIELLEETGIAHTADIRFGFPLPEGAIFNTKHFQVFDPTGKTVNAQFTPTAFWPDNSLKWVLIQFPAFLKSKEKAIYKVLFGRNIKSELKSSKLTFTNTGDSAIVNTGVLKARIGSKLLNKVWYKNKLVGGFQPDGLILIDEHGNKFTSSSSKPAISLEESGPEYLVVKLSGSYRNAKKRKYMKYVARLKFRKNSPVVNLTLTHINDYLNTEFTDITSLTLPFTADAPKVKDKKKTTSWRAFQMDDQYAMVAGKKVKKQIDGSLAIDRENGNITMAWRDFWRRFPKSYQVKNEDIVLEILPEQPNRDFGKNLPFYLMFPFCEGKYRFKWGMSFTERLRFDFSGKTPAKTLQADLDLPVIAVIPAAWYAYTKAFPYATVPQGKQFSAWDSFVERFFNTHMNLKMRQREYGYFNYGDWYGERNRNWGNNEYDLAHGMFSSFVRTGQRAYYRLALNAARHQADVDTVHAYPDPYFIGANHQHSIGHTGTWSQRPKHATWTHPYDTHTSAQNGHTWCNGMLDAWMLAGDPIAMQSAYELGEHIVWAMAPSFKRLGTHERSAGWSLKAILNLYKLTHDPIYLKAAKKIALVAFKEQKGNGAWPHRLPLDHARGKKNLYGNNIFLLGILLSSLKDYHEVTGDPKAGKAFLAGVDWVCKSYDAKNMGWPYSALKDGTPVGPFFSSLNMLIIDGIAYAAKITGSKKYANIAESAMSSRIMGGHGAVGKNMAQATIYSDSIIHNLNDYYQKYDRQNAYSIVYPESIAMLRAKIPDKKQFNVRGPDDKVFYIKFNKTDPVITLSRQKHGSRPKGWQFCNVTIFDNKGNKVFFHQYKPDSEFSRKVKLTGKRGSIFKVIFHDDMRGICNISGHEVQIMLNLAPGTTLGRTGSAKVYLTVPVGTKSFSIRMQGVHTGPYGMLLLQPDGKIGGLAESVNSGKCLLPWATGIANKDSASRQLNVKVPRGQDRKVWQLIMWAAGDAGLQVQGIPPYLTLNKEKAFKID